MRQDCASAVDASALNLKRSLTRRQPLGGKAAEAAARVVMPAACCHLSAPSGTRVSCVGHSFRKTLSGIKSLPEKSTSLRFSSLNARVQTCIINLNIYSQGKWLEI